MCVCESDYDSPKFWNEEWRKARKPHRCCECGRTIQPGERYEYVSAMWDYIDTFSTCEDCSAWRQGYLKAAKYVCGCSGFYIGMLWEEIREYCEEHLGYDGTIDGFDAADDGVTNRPVPYEKPARPASTTVVMPW